MNIAFDATAILGPMSKNRGIGNYSLSLFKNMIDRDPDNRYFLLNFFGDDTMKDSLRHPERLREDSFFTGADHFLTKDKAYQDLIGGIIKKYIAQNEIDVFVITSPFETQMPVYQKEWFADAKVAVLVYDVIPYVMKSHYLSDKDSYNWYMDSLQVARWADKVLVISQSVKDDLVEHLNFPEEQISVIWGASSEMFRELEISEAKKAALRGKFRITGDFVMCTGGDDERKNIAGLIKAYADLPKELIQKYQLVVVCKLQPASVIRYRTLADKLGVVGRVALTNFVSDEELVTLYNLATLVAFPSQYEGFGLPVVEAWACGTPVLTSNNSSLAQIAGDAAVLVNPFETKDITRGLREALTVVDLAELTEKGRRRLQNFKWEKVADAARLSLPEAPRRDAGVPVNERRLRLAYFSPLPPVQSGIADYSADILSELSKYMDIDVFIDKGYGVKCDLANNVHVYPHTKFKKRRALYDRILYQVGNSEFHTYMYPYVKKHGGIVVLHDLNMHGVILNKAFFSGRKHFGFYQSCLLEDYPHQEVKEILRRVQKGDISAATQSIYELELNGIVTNHAQKIIVHSREAKEKLLAKNIGRQVQVIPHYAKIKRLPDVGEAKRKLGLSEDKMIFASFGFVHETKRALPLVEAFARLSEEYEHARFVFVGKLAGEIKERFDSKVAEYGLSDKLKVTGYVDIDEFADYIDATDVCFNLRWPYNGETSGSLMRILAKGKCVVVNDIGSFGELPGEACVKLQSVKEMTPEEEIAEIYGVMKRLAELKGLREALGQNARKYAKTTLDLKLVAKEYADFILRDDAPNTLAEKDLASIAAHVALVKYTKEQCRLLAKTLAYGMESEKDSLEVPKG